MSLIDVIYAAIEDIDMDATPADLAEDIAQALTMASGGPDHIVVLKGSSWTIQHPLAERFEEGEANLVNCRYTGVVGIAARRMERPGTYRVWLKDGDLKWTRL